MSDRTCTQCKEVKPVEEFSWRRKAKGQRQSKCKACFTGILRNHHLTRKYGITTEQYEVMRAAQGYACGLCQRTEEVLASAGVNSQLVTDHDHTTGEVRMLLCGACNTGLGLFGDDPEQLIRAAEYIRRFRG